MNFGTHQKSDWVPYVFCASALVVLATSLGCQSSAPQRKFMTYSYRADGIISYSIAGGANPQRYELKSSQAIEKSIIATIQSYGFSWKPPDTDIPAPNEFPASGTEKPNSMQFWTDRIDLSDELLHKFNVDRARTGLDTRSNITYKAQLVGCCLIDDSFEKSLLERPQETQALVSAGQLLPKVEVTLIIALKLYKHARADKLVKESGTYNSKPILDKISKEIRFEIMNIKPDIGLPTDGRTPF